METDWRGIAKAVPDALSLWFESPEPEEPASVEERLWFARRYLELGWRLVPFHEERKKPHFALLPKSTNGRPTWRALAERRTQIADVESWLDQDPCCGLALATGWRSGVCVLDFDFVPTKVALTPTVRTIRGSHQYFAQHKKQRNRKLAGGDLKADGGLAALPPNRRENGVRYRWWELLAPWECDPAELTPEWLPQVAVVSEARGIARNTIPRLDRGIGEKGGLLLAHAHNEEAILAVTRHLGWDVPGVGSAFRCPLHPDTHPSAAVWHAEGMPVLLHCFHEEVFWPLVEVYASTITGELRTLGKGERAAWWARALVESGYVKRPYIDAPRLPFGVRPSVRKLYEGFCLLLAVRKLYEDSQDLSPFTWQFAAEWCGIRCPTTVGAAMKWLLGNGYLVRHPAVGKSALFGLGTPVRRCLLWLTFREVGDELGGGGFQSDIGEGEAGDAGDRGVSADAGEAGR